jgi:hypothetical protein
LDNFIENKTSIIKASSINKSDDKIKLHKVIKTIEKDKNNNNFQFIENKKIKPFNNEKFRLEKIDPAIILRGNENLKTFKIDDLQLNNNNNKNNKQENIIKDKKEDDNIDDNKIEKIKLINLSIDQVCILFNNSNFNGCISMIKNFNVDGLTLSECKSNIELEEIGIPKITSRTLIRSLENWKKNDISIDLLIENSLYNFDSSYKGRNNSIQISPNSIRIKYDCFLTHNWGIDKFNLKRVNSICKNLTASGLYCWFDEDEMRGDTRYKMTEGIDNSKCVVVFITSDYRDKVNSGDSRDNCRYEFKHSFEQFGAEKMIPVVMEKDMQITRYWKGELGASLSASLYIDFSEIASSGDIFDKKCSILADSIRKFV